MFFIAVGFALGGLLVALFAWLSLPTLMADRPATPENVLPFFARPAPAAPEPATTALAVAPAPAPAALPLDAGSLAARLERLELDQRRASEAAAAALAAASLAEAAQGSAPFADELTALGGLLPPSGDVRALQAAAAIGAPTQAQLAAEFPEAAAKAAVGARAPAQGDGVLARISHAFAAVFTIRRTGHLGGDGPDAILARAEALVEEGDLAKAFAELDKLPPGAREALAPWRTKAQRRLDVDRHVSAIRAQALRELALSAGRAP